MHHIGPGSSTSRTTVGRWRPHRATAARQMWTCKHGRWLPLHTHTHTLMPFVRSIGAVVADSLRTSTTHTLRIHNIEIEFLRPAHNDCTSACNKHGGVSDLHVCWRIVRETASTMIARPGKKRYRTFTCQSVSMPPGRSLCMLTNAHINTKSSRIKRFSSPTSAHPKRAQ